MDSFICTLPDSYLYNNASRFESRQMLEVKGLTISFQSDEGVIPAVRAVSFSVEEGETVAIVGESGSGKSVTAMALTRLLPEPPALYQAGEILLDGQSILKMNEKMLRKVRGNRIAYNFQEPATSLNPVFSIYEQIAETIRLHRPDVREVRKEVIYWLDQVGIIDNRFVDTRPMQDVFRPAVTASGNDSEHVLERECDPRPVMRLELGHGHDEIGA